MGDSVTIGSRGAAPDNLPGVELEKSPSKAAAPDVAALRRILRAKMAAVLNAHASWTRAIPERRGQRRKRTRGRLSTETTFFGNR